MGDVLFYRLTDSTAAQTLIALLPRALARFGAVELRGPSRAATEAMDRALWLGPDDGFLPHGMQGSAPDDADQPVLLTWEGALSDRACLMVLGGVDVPPEHAARVERACILFDGHDPDQVAHARGQWRAVTTAGLVAQFWAQEGHGWAKKAESGG